MGGTNFRNKTACNQSLAHGKGRESIFSTNPQLAEHLDKITWALGLNGQLIERGEPTRVFRFRELTASDWQHNGCLGDYPKTLKSAYPSSHSHHLLGHARRRTDCVNDLNRQTETERQTLENSQTYIFTVWKDRMTGKTDWQAYGDLDGGQIKKEQEWEIHGLRQRARHTQTKTKRESMCVCVCVWINKEIKRR